MFQVLSKEFGLNFRVCIVDGVTHRPQRGNVIIPRRCWVQPKITRDRAGQLMRIFDDNSHVASPHTCLLLVWLKFNHSQQRLKHRKTRHYESNPRQGGFAGSRPLVVVNKTAENGFLGHFQEMPTIGRNRWFRLGHVPFTVGLPSSKPRVSWGRGFAPCPASLVTWILSITIQMAATVLIEELPTPSASPARGAFTGRSYLGSCLFEFLGCSRC